MIPTETVTPALRPSALTEPLCTDRLDELLAHHASSGHVGVGQDQRELVAADAGEHVAVAEDAAQCLADAREQLVAGCVPERVVDLLEPVEVEQQQRSGAPVPARPADLALELLLEAPAAEQPGQCVPVGDLLELQLEALALGDVDRLHDDQSLAIGAVA